MKRLTVCFLLLAAFVVLGNSGVTKKFELSQKSAAVKAGEVLTFNLNFECAAGAELGNWKAIVLRKNAPTAFFAENAALVKPAKKPGAYDTIWFSPAKNNFPRRLTSGSSPIRINTSGMAVGDYGITIQGWARKDNKSFYPATVFFLTITEADGGKFAVTAQQGSAVAPILPPQKKSSVQTPEVQPQLRSVTVTADKLTVPFVQVSGEPGSVLNAPVQEQSAFTHSRPPYAAAAAQTFVKLFHDGKYLYCSVRCAEPFMQKIVAKTQNIPQQIWNNDSIEFNFDPDGRNQALGKIIADANGNLVDMFGYDDNTGNDRFILEYCRKSYTKVISANKNADSWSVELAIPLGVFYSGKLKDKFAPRINIGRTRYAVYESSDLFRSQNGHNRPRFFKELHLENFSPENYRFSVENLTIASCREKAGNFAEVRARILNCNKVYRNVKVIARLLTPRGEVAAVSEDIVQTYPDKLTEVKIPLAVTQPGRYKLELALLDGTDTLLSSQTMEAVLAWTPVSIEVIDPPYRNTVYATMSDFKSSTLLHIVVISKSGSPTVTGYSAFEFLISIAT